MIWQAIVEEKSIKIRMTKYVKKETCVVNHIVNYSVCSNLSKDSCHSQKYFLLKPSVREVYCILSPVQRKEQSAICCINNACRTLIMMRLYFSFFVPPTTHGNKSNKSRKNQIISHSKLNNSSFSMRHVVCKDF